VGPAPGQKVGGSNTVLNLEQQKRRGDQVKGQKRIIIETGKKVKQLGRLGENKPGKGAHGRKIQR